MFRFDHPSNYQRVSFGVYYRTTPPLGSFNVKNLNEYISYEVSIVKKTLSFYPTVKKFKL